MDNPVLLDVSRLVRMRLRGRTPTGIDRVGLAWVAHFASRAKALIMLGSRALVAQPDASQQIFDWLGAAESTPVSTLTDAGPASDRASATGKADAGKRQAALRALRAMLLAPIEPPSAGSWFLNTGHTGLDRPAYAAMIERLRVRPLFVIHDLIPLSHPQFCRADEGRRHARRMNHALSLAKAIVCNSEATALALTEFAESQSLPMPPATVALLGLNSPDTMSRMQASLRAPIDAPYFLMLGTIEPRKNHLLMLQVWQRLIERLGPVTPKLVLIGQRGWECEHVGRMLDRTPMLARHVLLPGRCEDRQMMQWMLHSRALLFPSFAEGFGLPVAEALQLGVPVIASDLPVFREFASTLPEYLDPLDAPGWLRAIEAYASAGHRRRERRVEALRGFSAPCWSAHFARVDELMQRVERMNTPGARASKLSQAKDMRVAHRQ